MHKSVNDVVRLVNRPISPVLQRGSDRTNAFNLQPKFAKLSLAAACCASLLCWPFLGYAQNESKPVTIIEPKKTPQPAKPAKIDTEKFQVGAYFGALSVENFNTNAVSGLAVTYQLSDNYLLLANYARSDVGKSTFEKREGLSLLTDDQRKLTYWTLSGGYKLFSARSFLGARHKYDSDIYLTAGVGKMEFAGVDGNGLALGVSYRIVFTDWLVATFDVKDLIFEQRDAYHIASLFNPEDYTDTKQNIEFSFGINALF